MEHTSENRTYRRLLMSAKGCAPRDFWIKWTRLDGDGAYSVKDDPVAENIRFEIGEDVPQKIREKEYRFLVYGNSDKYRVAMGRKNIVEWREIIKRAIKRGELEKAERIITEAAPAPEVKEEQPPEPSVKFSDPQLSDKLMEILAKCGMGADTSEVEEVAETPAENEEFDEAMRIARIAAGIDVSESGELTFGNIPDSYELTETEEVEAEEVDVMPEQGHILDSFAEDVEFSSLTDAVPSEPLEISLFEVSEDTVAGGIPEDNPFSKYLSMEDEVALSTEAEDELVEDVEASEPEEEDEAKPNAEIEVSEPDESEELSCEAENIDVEAEPEEEELTAEPEKEDSLELEEENSEPLFADDIEQFIQQTIESIEEEAPADENDKTSEALMEQLRLEAERLRIREEELARREEELRRESERVAALILEAEEERSRLREERLKEEKQKDREKALYAEAARLAIEENQRKKQEMIAEEEAKAAERARLEIMRAAEEERIRLEAQRAAEVARIENELRQKVTAENIPDVQKVEPEQAQNYTYVSKIVKLMFRHRVDPHVTSRIHELITDALGYFHKEHVYMKVRASIPESSTVVLNFVKIPKEEMDLLIDIIKILGNSDLGISKIIME